MNLFCILFLLMFIFALLGMEMFRGRYTEERGFDPYVLSEEGVLRPSTTVHFENFAFSMVTIFVVISGENWNEIMI